MGGWQGATGHSQGALFKQRPFRHSLFLVIPATSQSSLRQPGFEWIGWGIAVARAVSHALSSDLGHKSISGGRVCSQLQPSYMDWECPPPPRRKTQVLFAKMGIQADRAAHTHCCEHPKCYSYSIYFPLELTSLRLLPFYLFLLPFFPFLGSLI